MAFDPSTAKPISSTGKFDPSTAKPVDTPEEKQKSFLGKTRDAALAAPREIGKEFSEGLTTSREALHRLPEDVQNGKPSAVASDIGKAAAGGLQSATAPATGAARAWVGNPIRTIIPQDTLAGKVAAQTAEDLGAMFGPGAGLKAAREAATVLPTLSPEVHKLLDAGVRLTPGQLIGGYAKRMEEAAKSVPLLGHFIRNAEARSADDFNIAVVNEALAPIAQKLPGDVTAGHEAVAFGQQALNQAYDELLPSLTFKIDPAFGNDISLLKQMASELPPDQAHQFEKVIANRLIGRLQPNGTMDGRTMKQVDSELRVFASGYRSSSDAAQRQLGEAVGEVRSSLRSAMMRQNPVAAEQLASIDRSYALFTRVENAASRRATANGVFSANDLLQAVKKGDQSVRKRATGAGRSLFQGTAEAGQKVLGNRLSDSGTTERAMIGAGLLGGVGATNPYAVLGVGAAALPYSEMGGAALRKTVTQGPQAISGAARAVENASPKAVLSSLAGQGLGSALGD